MQALVMLSDGTLVSDVSWDGNNVGTILDGFGSPLKDGNNIVLFDYGAYKIKILDTTTWEIKSVIASSLPAMQVGYYAFIMDNVIQEIVASVVHGPYHGKKSYDAHVVTSIRADSSFKSSGSKNMTNSGSATQSLVPDLSKIEVRDSSKVSDWINSFTDKTASDVVEIGGLLFKSYN